MAAAAPKTRNLLFASLPASEATPASESTEFCHEQHALMEAIGDVETAASLAPLTQLRLGDLLKQSPEQIEAVKRVGIVVPSDWECQAATSEGVHPCPYGVPSQCRYYNFNLDEYHKKNWTTNQWASLVPSVVTDWAALTADLDEPEISQLMDDVCAHHYCAKNDHECCETLPPDPSLPTDAALGDALCGGDKGYGGLADYFAKEQWGAADWRSDPNVATHYVSFEVNRLEMGPTLPGGEGAVQLYSPGLDALHIGRDGYLEFNPLGSKVTVPIDESIQYSFDANPGAPNQRRMSEAARLPLRSSDRKAAQETRFEGSCHPSSGCRRVALKARPGATTTPRRQLTSSDGRTRMPTGLTADRVSSSTRLVSPESMRMVGRWAQQSGDLRGDWPGIGFELRLNAGPESKLVLNAWSVASSSYDQALRCAYGMNPSAWGSQPNIVLNLKSAQTEYRIDPPKTLGVHVLKCIKVTEKDDDGRGIQFKGIGVSPDVEVLPSPSPPTRKMVFYGDSDTACGSCCSSPKYGGDDVTSGWAYQLADRFQADAQFIAKGGQAVDKCGESGDAGLCPLIPRTLPWARNSRYQFDEFKADVVTVFLGANDNWPRSDHSTGSGAGRRFQERLLALLNKAWDYHSGEGGARPAIIGVCGGSGSPKHDTSSYCQNVKAAITQFNSAAHQAHYVEIDKAFWTRSMVADSVFQGCYDHWSDYGGRGVVESVLSSYQSITGWAPTQPAPLPNVVAQTSGNVCPSGTTKPLSVGQCKLAATALGLEFREQEKMADWPAGCYQIPHGEQSGIWWNKHPRGSQQPAASGVGPLCVIPPVNPPMTPPVDVPIVVDPEPAQPLQVYRLLNSGWKGSDSCGALGLSRIHTIGDCRSAATALQLVFSGKEKYGNWPRGCYRWAEDNTVLWNEHRKGSTNDNATPVCVGAEAAPSLTGESSCAASTQLQSVNAIATKEDCKKAATALKKDYDMIVESAKGWPRGCYLCESCGAAYWNTRAEGGANSDATPICSSTL